MASILLIKTFKVCCLKLSGGTLGLVAEFKTALRIFSIADYSAYLLSVSIDKIMSWKCRGINMVGVERGLFVLDVCKHHEPSRLGCSCVVSWVYKLVRLIS